METRLLLATAVLGLSTLNIGCVYFHLLPWYAPHARMVVGTVCGLWPNRLRTSGGFLS